jgi:hypothetical protein
MRLLVAFQPRGIPFAVSEGQRWLTPARCLHFHLHAKLDHSVRRNAKKVGRPLGIA